MAPRSLPNAITLMRLAGVPVIVWLTYSRTTAGIALAAALFALAVASDWLDGYLARRLHVRSAFGTFLDPLTDKVMVLCLLFVFADRGLVPTWLALLNMAREFAATAVRHAASAGSQPVGANWMGKTKFCLQAGFVGLGYVHLLLCSTGRVLPGGTGLLFWTLLGVTAVSYVFLARFVLWHRARLTDAQEGRSGP
jgi:CDP-diacylglycerol--glycerol-3-phosphate 3-phosphatidyltransferase